MKIAIIGGGPAGLYAAILLKKQRPTAAINVYERNRADDTFGFGVVFSDATLDNFEKYDLPSYQSIIREFAYWDDIAVHFRGTVHRVGGNGFCGCSRRALLMILQARARDLGVVLHFEADVDNEALFAESDLLVLADGINSRFRDKFADHFAPEIDLRSNKFTWMGSTKPLDAFTFIFEDTPWGRSSPTPINTTPTAPPGYSRPIPRPSRAPGSMASARRPPPHAWRRFSPHISTAINSSPIARSGGSFR